MPFGLQPWHLLIVLVVVVIVMGPKRLPEIGQAMGKTLRGFKDELDGGPQTPTPMVSAAVAPSEPVAPAATTPPAPPPVVPPDQV